MQPRSPNNSFAFLFSSYTSDPDLVQWCSCHGHLKCTLLTYMFERGITIDRIIASSTISNFINSSHLDKQEDHRSYNRAYRDLTFFLALHSQRTAHSNAVLDDSLITADTTSLDRSASHASHIIKELRYPRLFLVQWLFQPRSQGLSSLPPLVVGRKTLVAAGHVTTCDTNFSTGVESTNNFCRSQLKRKKGHLWLHLWTGQTIYIYLYSAYWSYI